MCMYLCLFWFIQGTPESSVACLPSLLDYNEDHNGNKFSKFNVLSSTVLINVYCHFDGILLCIYFIFILLSNKSNQIKNTLL